MARKRISFTLAAVIVFFVILLALVSIRFTGTGTDFPNPAGNLLREALAPLQGGVMSVTTGVRNSLASLWQFNQLSRQNQSLKTQVAELTRENNQLKQKILAGMRYEDMAKKFDSPAIWNDPYVGATVVDRNPSNWYHTIVINRGAKDGVKVDDPVITNLGLVGKVIKVTDSTSEIILILDPEGQVSGVVRQSNGAGSFGIVVGDYKRGSVATTGSLSMEVPKEDKVNPGDLVLTSGMGGVYPKDIPIGTVQQVTLDPSGLLKTATITPQVNFANLEEVFVVLTGGK